MEQILVFVFSMKTVWFLLGIYLLFSMVFMVGGKKAYIIETLGKPDNEARMPGLNFKAPWPIQSVVAEVNLQQRETKADVSVKTSDNAFMKLPVSVQYQVSDSPVGAVKAHYELEDPEEQITSYILNNVKGTTSGMTVTELYANRSSIEEEVKGTLSEKFATYGYIIKNVLVDEPQPSKEVRNSYNSVIASERLKEAAKNEAEAIKIKLIGTAEAEAESKRLQGKGMAEMRVSIATGLEKSMETMIKAGLTVEQAIDFLNETNRQDTISNVSTHGNLILMDVEKNTQLAETFAAIKSTLNTTPAEPADSNISAESKLEPSFASVDDSSDHSIEKE